MAVLLLALSLMLPQLNLPKRTYHYVVTIDITQSMGVPDMMIGGQRVSRLKFVKSAAVAALAALPCGSTIGWSIFTEHRTFALLLPLEVCENYETLLSTLDRVGPGMRWRDASQVGKGLYWSIRSSLAGAGSRIIFLSDGHEAPPRRDGQQLMPELAEQVSGWVIGVGAEQPSRIPKTDTGGQVSGYWSADDVVQSGQVAEHLSAIREPHLQALADYSGLDYLRLEETDQLSEAMMSPDMATHEASPTQADWIPALIALMLLCWRFGFQR